MTIKTNSSAAELLTRQINSTKRTPAGTIEDEFGQAVARRLEQRGIVKVPGLPVDETEPQWYDLMIEHGRRHREFKAEREAQRQAEQQAAKATPDLIRSTLAGAAGQPTSTMPLNGAAVLRAALNGGRGTVNGAPA